MTFLVYFYACSVCVTVINWDITIPCLNVITALIWSFALFGLKYSLSQGKMSVTAASSNFLMITQPTVDVTVESVWYPGQARLCNKVEF